MLFSLCLLLLFCILILSDIDSVDFVTHLLLHVKRLQLKLICVSSRVG